MFFVVDNNKLKLLKSAAFDNLKKIENLWLQGNICIDVEFNGDQITKMKEIVDANCGSEALLKRTNLEKDQCDGERDELKKMRIMNEHLNGNLTSLISLINTVSKDPCFFPVFQEIAKTGNFVNP